MARAGDCDDQFGAMTPEELRTAADKAAAADDQDTLEAMSDSLLRLRQGWRDGAHSEQSDTQRNRRIRRECHIDEAAIIGTTADSWALDVMMDKGVEAGLTKPQLAVWCLCQIWGHSQHYAATLLGIKQAAVSRRLSRARAIVWDHLDRSDPAIRIFLQESHRSAYFRPSHRPRLPVDLEPAREIIEREDGVSTHIMPDRVRRVEIWRNGYPVEIGRDERGEPINLGHSYRQVIALARKSRKLSQAM